MTTKNPFHPHVSMYFHPDWCECAGCEPEVDAARVARGCLPMQAAREGVIYTSPNQPAPKGWRWTNKTLDNPI